MKKSERNFLVYLNDIKDSIQWILQFTKGLTLEEFVEDRKTIDAVIRNFEIIGEASKSVPREIKEEFDAIPWREMYLMRNKISHEYFGIDYELIWDVILNELPSNLSEIERIIKTRSKK